MSEQGPFTADAPHNAETDGASLEARVPIPALVERLREHLRERWQDGERIPVEACLEKHPLLLQHSEAVVDLVYQEVILREERGERAELAEYLERFPELQAQIIIQFQVHRAVCSGLSAELIAPTCADTMEVRMAEPARSVNPASVQGRSERLGPYELLQVLGKGGMGIVYRAEDLALRRAVALKVMLPEAAADPAARQRFQREAQAAAAVKHECIVTIYQVGEDHGVPYLAMELLRGESLSDRLERQGTLPMAEVVRLGREVARGLAAAHAAGLIHRDVKPANIWLEEPAEAAEASENATLAAAPPRVKLLDFGLVRPVRKDVALTQAGAVLGTPAFMSPEQARGQTVEFEADLFSLGCVLYSLCTGRSPFARGDVASTLAAVLTEHPPALHEVDERVPRTLSDLVMTLLEKDAKKRPASAGAVVEALSRIERGETNLPQRTRRRRRLATALGLAVLLAVIFAGAVVLRVRTDRGVITVQTTDPDIELVARKNGALISIRNKKTGQSWQLDTNKYTLGMAGKPGGLVIEVPDQQPLILKSDGQEVVKISRIPARTPAPGPGDSVPLDSFRREDITAEALAWIGQGDELRAPAELVGLFGDARFRLPGENGKLSFSRDGKLLAVPSGLRVLLFDARSGRFLRYFVGPSQRVWMALFSPDGKSLVAGTWDGTIWLWEVASGRPLRTLTGHTGPVTVLAYSPDGQTLGSSSDDHTARLWDADDGRNKGVLRGHTHIVSGLAFSPDGKMVATGSWDKTVRLWEAATGKPTQVLQDDDFHTRLLVAFSPDGKWLAAGGDTLLKVWDTAAWVPVRRTRTPAYFLAFARDSKSLWTAGHAFAWNAAHVVRRWDLTKQTEPQEYPLRSRGPWAHYSFHPDGKMLASLSENERVVHLHDMAGNRPLLGDIGHRHLTVGAAFSPDGKTLASSSHDGTIRLWNLAGEKTREGQRPAHTLTGHGDFVNGVAFSPDGRTLASASHDKTIRLWDAAKGGRLWTFTGPTGVMEQVTFSPDGKLLAAGTWDKKVWVWDTGTHAQRYVFTECGAPVQGVAFSGDSRQLAAACEDGKVRIWEMTTGALQRTFSRNAQAWSVAFLPDKETLTTGWADGRIIFYSLTSGSVQQEFLGPSSHLRGLDVRSDGRLLAASGFSGVLQLWDLSQTPPRRQTWRLFPYGGWIRGVVFSPEGRHLATCNFDGTLHLFRLGPPRKEGLPGLPKPDPLAQKIWQVAGEQSWIRHVALSRNGKLAFNSALDGQVRVRDAASGNELRHLRHPEQVLRLAVTPDDSFLLTACKDGVIRVWDLKTGKEARQLEGAHDPWSMSLAPDGRTVFSHAPGDLDMSLVTDLATGKQLRRFELGGYNAFLPGGKQLFSVGWRSLSLADAQDGRRKRSFLGHRELMRDAAVSPDGRLGVTVSGGMGSPEPGNPTGDCSARVWDLQSGQELACWQDNAYTRWSTAFFPDGRRVAVGSDDGTIRIYDVPTGREEVRIDCGGPVEGVAVSADGRCVLAGGGMAVSGGYVGVLGLWRVPDLEPAGNKR